MFYRPRGVGPSGTGTGGLSSQVPPVFILRWANRGLHRKVHGGICDCDETTYKEEEAKREAAGLSCILISSSLRVQLQRCDDNGNTGLEKPGTANLKKEGSSSNPRSKSNSRSSSRSRSSSTASVSSTRSQAALTVEKSRKERRESDLEMLRLMERARNRSPVGGESHSDSDTEVVTAYTKAEDEDVNMESNPGKDGKKGQKRKHVSKQRSRSTGDAKRGRPLTIGDYANLAASKKALNDQKRIELELEMYEKLKNMSSGELYTSLKLDLEDAIEDFRESPNADVASTAREGMDDVLRVARVSKNLQGVCVMQFKQGAILASAALEVLRTRADGKADKDVQYQIRALQKELDTAKTEAKEAKEKVARLRREAEEIQATNYQLRSNRVIRDSPSPERAQGSSVVEETAHDQQDMNMEVDVDVPFEGNDEERKKAILPPKEEWPPAIRPKIKGVAKIIEDRPLVRNHKITVVRSPTQGKEKRDKEDTSVKKDDAQLFMERLTPMLDTWLSNSLDTLGLRTNGEERKGRSRSVKGKVKGPPSQPPPQKLQAPSKEKPSESRANSKVPPPTALKQGTAPKQGRDKDPSKAKEVNAPMATEE